MKFNYLCPICNKNYKEISASTLNRACYCKYCNVHSYYISDNLYYVIYENETFYREKIKILINKLQKLKGFL